MQQVAAFDAGPAPAGAPAPARQTAAEAPQVDPAATRREIIYTADVALVAFNTQVVIDSVKSFAEKHGGYMTALQTNAIAVRIPAAHFDAALEHAATLGEVVARDVKASDVTAELFDLNLRIDNAEKARARILEHLSKSEKLEDTIKLEAELTRLTEEIERMKGRQRFLQDQVAMSTLRVSVNSPAPMARQNRQQIPFAWVRALAIDFVSGNAAFEPRQGRWGDRGAKFDLPQGYIRYFDSESLTQAMNADGVFIKLQRNDNFDKGDPQFWTSLARRVLVDDRQIAAGEATPVTLESGLVAARVTGTREVAGRAYAYMLVLVPTQRHVHVFEAWGPSQVMQRDAEGLDRTIRSLRVR